MKLKGRPEKSEAIAIAKRNREIIKMSKRYPIDYIAAYYGLTKGRVSQIIKQAKKGR